MQQDMAKLTVGEGIQQSFRKDQPGTDKAHQGRRVNPTGLHDTQQRANPKLFLAVLQDFQHILTDDRLFPADDHPEIQALNQNKYRNTSRTDSPDSSQNHNQRKSGFGCSVLS